MQRGFKTFKFNLMKDHNDFFANALEWLILASVNIQSGFDLFCVKLFTEIHTIDWITPQSFMYIFTGLYAMVRFVKFLVDWYKGKKIKFD